MNDIVDFLDRTHRSLKIRTGADRKASGLAMAVVMTLLYRCRNSTAEDRDTLATAADAVIRRIERENPMPQFDCPDVPELEIA